MKYDIEEHVLILFPNISINYSIEDYLFHIIVLFLKI